MTSSPVRRYVLLCAALIALAGAPLAAQTVQREKIIKVVELPVTEQEFHFARPIVRVGQDYTLKAGDTAREVRSVLGNVRIDGLVTNDVVVVLGDATISNTAVIEGSLVVVGGSATVAQGALVHRDFVVVGGTADIPADFSPQGDHIIVGSPMLGDSLRAIAPWLTRGLLWGRLIVPGLTWVWIIVGISFLVGFAMNHLFDRQVSSAASALARRPLSAFLMGLLVLLLSGPLLTIVAASIIGLAVVPFAIAALIVAGLIGKIAVTRAIGRSVVPEGDSESRLQSWRSFTIGFLVITVAYMVPVIGILTWALVGVFGLGAATMSLAATLRRERPATPPKAPVEPPPIVPPPGPATDHAFPTAPPPSYGQSAASAFAGAESSARMAEADRMVSEGSPPPLPAAGAAGIEPSRSPSAASAAGDLTVYPRASFLDRVAAFALDVVLVAITNAVLRIPGGDDGGFLIVVLAYTIAFTAWKGTTLGGIICGIRIVRTNGAELRFVDALVRGLSSIFSIVALGIGCFWMLNDPERQMWHDKIAGTVVVKLPRELVLA